MFCGVVGYTSVMRSPQIIAVFAALSALSAPCWAQGGVAPLPPPAEEMAHGPYIPMIFPVFGGPRFQRELIDTFGDPRGGGTRKHEGQDMMAPQMTPLVAVFDGVVSFVRTDAPNAHNILRLQGDNGWTAAYLHINNDTPQTNDGLGSRDFAFAPNLRPGMRVIAGQLVAYVGNSGNAETVGHHLHFELQGPTGIVNAYTSLKRAQRITALRLNLPAPEVIAGAGEVRLDAIVKSVERGNMEVIPLAWQNAAGKTTIEQRPGRKRVQIDAATILSQREKGRETLTAEALKEGDSVTIIAPAKEEASGLRAKRVLVESVPVAVAHNPAQIALP